MLTAGPFDLDDASQLRVALLDARAWALALYAHLAPAQWQVPYLQIVNPPLWELGHLGWFQEYWCLRRRPDAPSRLKHGDAFYDSRSVPHAARWSLPLPDWQGTMRYLDAVLADTLTALDKSRAEERYFFQLALLHEDMHSEAMLMTLQTLGYPAPTQLASRAAPAMAGVAAREAMFDGGAFQLGARPGQGFAFDNEKWAHAVTLQPFAMSTAAVTNGEFAAFVEDGGYATRAFWSQPGWQWRERQARQAPVYWQRDAGNWLVRRFDQWQPLAVAEPVMHVSLHEAEAWCRWAGRRLPSEAEWEYAARAGRADNDRYPWGDSGPGRAEAALDCAFGGPVPAAALPATDSPGGLRQLIGNVWEWTGSPFAPYPGFAPDPYREYSAPWFHTHQVLRGGSFCTRSRLVHNRFRNFYTPERCDMFVGFRTCRKC